MQPSAKGDLSHDDYCMVIGAIYLDSFLRVRNVSRQLETQQHFHDGEVKRLKDSIVFLEHNMETLELKLEQAAST
jgi:hypothetical protein